MGNTVEFQMVTEDSNSGDIPPLFGAPSVSNDSLNFDPVGFGAFSGAAGGVDVTDGNLKFMVKSKLGFALNNISFSEGGDTTLTGFGGDSTISAVIMGGFLNISEVDNVGINTITLPFKMTFAPPGGVVTFGGNLAYGLGSNGGGGPLFSTLWTGNLLIDLTTANPAVAAAFAAQSIVPVLGITKISVDFDNTLVAVSAPGTSSLIAKKDTIIITMNIPEPTSCMLAMLGLVASVMFVRRSR